MKYFCTLSTTHRDNKDRIRHEITHIPARNLREAERMKAALYGVNPDTHTEVSTSIYVRSASGSKRIMVSLYQLMQMTEEYRTLKQPTDEQTIADILGSELGDYLTDED